MTQEMPNLDPSVIQSQAEAMRAAEAAAAEQALQERATAAVAAKAAQETEDFYTGYGGKYGTSGGYGTELLAVDDQGRELATRNGIVISPNPDVDGASIWKYRSVTDKDPVAKLVTEQGSLAAFKAVRGDEFISPAEEQYGSLGMRELVSEFNAARAPQTVEATVITKKGNIKDKERTIAADPTKADDLLDVLAVKLARLPEDAIVDTLDLLNEGSKGAESATTHKAGERDLSGFEGMHLSNEELDDLLGRISTAIEHQDIRTERAAAEEPDEPTGPTAPEPVEPEPFRADPEEEIVAPEVVVEGEGDLDIDEQPQWRAPRPSRAARARALAADRDAAPAPEAEDTIDPSPESSWPAEWLRLDGTSVADPRPEDVEDILPGDPDHGHETSPADPDWFEPIVAAADSDQIPEGSFDDTVEPEDQGPAIIDVPSVEEAPSPARPVNPRMAGVEVAPANGSVDLGALTVDMSADTTPIVDGVVSDAEEPEAELSPQESYESAISDLRDDYVKAWSAEGGLDDYESSQEFEAIVGRVGEAISAITDDPAERARLQAEFKVQLEQFRQGILDEEEQQQATPERVKRTIPLARRILGWTGLIGGNSLAPRRTRR